MNISLSYKNLYFDCGWFSSENFAVFDLCVLENHDTNNTGLFITIFSLKIFRLVLSIGVY